MILADTSVWIDHLRQGNEKMAHLLERGLILCHPLIIGELACGTMKNRKVILDLLHTLPGSNVVDQNEILVFIENYSLMGRGIGIVDAHLLASAMLTHCHLWTLDKKLFVLAHGLGLASPERIK